MPLEFVGDSLALSDDGLNAVVGILTVPVPEIWAVVSVETRGSGFLPDRRPMILFERHVFSRMTHHRFDAAHPDISNRMPGNYGAGGTHQYDRLQRAIALDRNAALQSTSWGIGQLMGFNFAITGFATVEAMVAAMSTSEDQQLMGMAREIHHNRLDNALRSHNWANFARGYNGSNYAINHYDTRLGAAYRKFVQGPLPDLAVREAQLYLTFLGYSPGTIDGLMGRFTRAALNDFQTDAGIAVTTDVEEETLIVLRERALG